MLSPGMQQDDVLRRLDSSLMTNLFRTHRIVVKRAKGTQIEDVDGNKYMDFMTVITTAYLGHNPDYLVEAIKRAAEELIAGGSYVSTRGISSTLLRSSYPSSPGSLTGWRSSPAEVKL